MKNQTQGTASSSWLLIAVRSSASIRQLCLTEPVTTSDFGGPGLGDKLALAPCSRQTAGNRRRTPCNQTARADTQRQQTPRSEALSKDSRWSRDGDVCVHTAEAMGRLVQGVVRREYGADGRSHNDALVGWKVWS